MSVTERQGITLLQYLADYVLYVSELPIARYVPRAERGFCGPKVEFYERNEVGRLGHKKDRGLCKPFWQRCKHYFAPYMYAY